MLSAIKEIGKWQINKSGKDELEVLIKEPKFKGSGKVVLIKVDVDKNAFEDIELEDYDSSKVQKYFFTGGVSQGPNPTPVANIPNVKKGRSEEETSKSLESQIRKTFEGKIQKWFDKYSNSSKEDTNFLKSIGKIISDNEDKIIQAIKSCIKDLDKKEGKLLMILIKQNNEWKYIGDFEIFRKSLKDIETQKTVGISASDKDCSICGMRKALVSGDSSVFKFYTIDKPGFVTGGFDENLAWKNFPVCHECKLELEEGKKYLDKLSFKFYGLNYYLIPKLLIGGEDILDEILSILSDTTKTITLKERCKKRLLSDEDFIMDYLSEKEDRLSINILFLYQPPLSSAEYILLHIEDVLPSRIRKVFEAKNYVDRVFDNDSDKGFTFGTIRTFFSQSSKRKKVNYLNKYFLEIVDSVFKGKGLDFPFLVNFCMRKIQRDFIDYDSKGKERYNFHSSIKDALMNTIFFENLNLITFEEVKDMEESIFEEVFKRYGNTFSSPVKRGIFLLGALTQKLLNIQAYKRQGAKPFMKKLKSLKMDQNDIMGLLPDVQDKLEQYDSFDTWRRLAQESSNYLLLNAGDSWKLTNDEINFYFACGMNLMEQVTNIIYPETKKEE